MAPALLRCPAPGLVLGARPHAALANPKPRRSAVLVRAKVEEYVAPSSRTGATELAALERYTEIVPDVLLSQALQDVEAPKAATASRSVLYGILNSPSSFARYKIAIEQARYFDKCKAAGSAEARLACQVDKALVNVGALFAESVSGRVSTEVDPAVARDEAGIVARGRGLVALYGEMGVPKDRILLRIPATWQGIQAARTLEAEGIATHLVLVYCFVQGAAAAQAGASIIQPNVGRLLDWYNANPGVVRDPNGPREGRAMAMAGYGAAAVNPGLLLVEKLYSYCRAHAPGTRVMASGIRTREEAKACAGVDYLVAGPKVVAALAAASTLEGYNDGLSAGRRDAAGVRPRLTPEAAAQFEFHPEETRAIDSEALFSDRLDLAATQLVEADLKRLAQDADRLAPFFSGAWAGGQE